MIQNPGERGNQIFPIMNPDALKRGVRVRFTPHVQENRQARLRTLRQLIRAGEYYPSAYAIADAILLGSL